jgi:hypothetical protein
MPRVTHGGSLVHAFIELFLLPYRPAHYSYYELLPGIQVHGCLLASLTHAWQVAPDLCHTGKSEQLSPLAGATRPTNPTSYNL